MGFLLVIINRSILLKLLHVSKLVPQSIAPSWQLERRQRINKTLRLIHHSLVLAELVDLRAGSARIEAVPPQLVVQLVNVLEIVSQLLQALSVGVLQVHVYQDELEGLVG